jgi:polyisoprenoid-binding protein YceI
MKSLLLIFLFSLAALWTPADHWNADATKAKIAFSVKGPFGTVHGSFSGLKAGIQLSEKDLAGSSISASIDPKTVSTGISLRNSDLRNKEIWLNTDKYPVITFKSKKIEKTAAGYKVLGDLTLKGTTKAVEIPFSFNPNASEGVFKGQFTLNREDYHIGKSGGSVGDAVTITLEVPVKK